MTFLLLMLDYKSLNNLPARNLDASIIKPDTRLDIDKIGINLLESN